MTGIAFHQSSSLTIDDSRIGAFGFSAGGFTVVSAIGGISDFSTIRRYCTSHTDDFACRLLGSRFIHSDLWKSSPSDGRIKAAVIAAPAFGYSFTDDSLAKIQIPVQLWQAQNDQIVPSPDNAESLRDRLPTTLEYRIVENAGHYDFMPPCSPGLSLAAPTICAPTPGFDRTSFHDKFNQEVVKFFQRTLG